MDLKTKLETTTKNHQTSIQNLKAKFDRFADKQYGQPSGSLPSNTQHNLKGSSSKPYQPPQAQNKHVNAVFTRSGKTYDPPINPNDQPNDSETPINFDSGDEDDEPTPQPKSKELKPALKSTKKDRCNLQTSTPTNIKGIRSFLGHVGFYQRFSKDFSKITRPFTKLLEKDTSFEFDDKCHNAFKLLKEKLTCVPVITSPSWNLSFELMCDASDFAVGAILGQKYSKNFHPIYFASKTLNAAQQNYTITKKELMVVVFAFENFQSCLVLSKTIIHTDHSALRHLFNKQDAKPPPKSLEYCFYKAIDIEIKEGTENVVADHLSQIENDETSDDSEVDDNFPRETLMKIDTRDEP
ncbi:reverse transcriptase domain-containing protein [Tanacetum coccineum]|uniref:Reverse transcriptase domain-containing protein n=1 Tax=Tanacetum coccineum TaxID=301880 RepID=A0ABQ5HIZ7_9ASTR